MHWSRFGTAARWMPGLAAAVLTLVSVGVDVRPVDAAEAASLSDTWQGDKLDPKWHVTVLGDAQDQASEIKVDNGKLRIRGGGSDIWINGDNGTFIWQPANGDFSYHLGLAYARNGDNVKAKETLQAALKANPNAPLAGDAKSELARLGS